LAAEPLSSIETQVLAEEVKRSLSMNRVPAVEVFDGRAVRDAELNVEMQQQCLAGIFEKFPTDHFSTWCCAVAICL
jgi:hypothetical protein